MLGGLFFNYMNLIYNTLPKPKPAVSTATVTTSPQTVHYVQRNIEQVGLFASFPSLSHHVWIRVHIF